MRTLIYRGPNNVLHAGYSRYRETGLKEDLFNGHLFFEDTESILLTDANCAAYFLNQFQTDDFRCSLNNSVTINTLLEIYNRVKNHYTDEFYQLKPILLTTLDYIEINIKTLTNEDFEDVKSYANDLGWYYSVSPYCLLVNSVSMIRRRATAEYVLAMIRHLKLFPSTNIDNSENYLLITDIKLRGIKKWFGDISLDHDKFPIASIKLIDKGQWKFTINELGASDNFIYKKNAYQKVADFLAFSFNAKVELVSKEYPY